MESSRDMTQAILIMEDTNNEGQVITNIYAIRSLAL